MNFTSVAHSTPIPVFVGFAAPQPEAPTDPDAPPRNPLFKQRRPNSALRDSGFDWARHDLEPRWLKEESSNCAAALEPSIFHNNGAEELDRYLKGAAGREETALVVAVIGDLGDEQPRHPFASADAALSLPGVEESIAGSRLPRGAEASLAPDLDAPDRDLGLRLLNQHRPDEVWWSLSLHGNVLQRGDGGPAVQYPVAGRLQPILLDGLGNPVVAAWAPGSGDQRWYVIPDGSDWHTVLDWLVQQALPEHAPGALRRARSSLALDQALHTPAETVAYLALEALDANYAKERSRAESELAQAKAAAEPIRNGLLYGTAAILEDTVATVLRAAGFGVVDLDDLLGETASADLLASFGNQRRLVEVKSAGGSASESLVAALLRHLQTWPQLRPDEPVSGGVLIVNHQHRLDPAERTDAVYSRQAFTASLTVLVLSTSQLFEWWRNSDWAGLRSAILGQTEHNVESAFGPIATLDADTEPHDPEPISGWRRRFSRRGASG
jgi:hypothetical protein